MSRVVHFEIPADEPERAIGFYQNVFGWQITKWDGPMPYWLVTTGPDNEPGINGGLMKKNPGQPVANTIQVKSLDSTITSIEKSGGKIVVPRMPIPGVGWLAYFKDTEDNIFGVMEADAKAG